MKVDGVEVVDCLGCDEREIRKYIRIVEEKEHAAVSHLVIDSIPDGEGDVSLDYVCHARKFERIRRITGYLVGTIDRWNNGKIAELKDRVKHG